PNLEIIVVDDGSTDDTAAIARRYTRAKLLTIDHAGLSVARNAGFQAASNPFVVYLDSDAYPTPDWLYYLVLGLDGPNVGPIDGPAPALICGSSGATDEPKPSSKPVTPIGSLRSARHGGRAASTTHSCQPSVGRASTTGSMAPPPTSRCIKAVATRWIWPTRS